MDTLARIIPGLQPHPPTPSDSGVHEARFSRAPASQFVGAHFYSDTFDGGVNEFGPCPWPVRTIEYTEPEITADVVTRHLLPAVNDRCWVMFFGDGNDPVILMWWPPNMPSSWPSTSAGVSPDTPAAATSRWTVPRDVPTAPAIARIEWVTERPRERRAPPSREKDGLSPDRPTSHNAPSGREFRDPQPAVRTVTARGAPK